MNQHKFFAFVLCVLLFSALHAQVNDDFSDGDFLVNPEWIGDTSKFDVNGNSELWLNAPAVNDAAYISTESQSINNASWECKIRMDFNPSGSNYARFYIVSNQLNLGSPLNGYFVQVGGTDDDICLYKQTGTTITKIIDGDDGVLNTSQVNVRIKVTRDNLGNWVLQADTSGNFNYITYGTAFHDQHVQSFYCGFRCVYTATRSDKFFFDDVLVSGLPYNDGIAPFVVGVEISNPTELLVDFSDPVYPSSAQNVNNYFISNGIGYPTAAVINPLNSSQVVLSLGNTIQSNLLYSIHIQQIQDFQFNLMSDTNLYFADYTVVPGDVIINEIMADPTPAINLPEYEYVELLNTSQFPINLQGWKLKVNNTIRVLPSYNLMPDSFLVIVDVNGAMEFLNTPIIGISSFPSITNSGATITLLTSQDQHIDEVAFTLAWYNNPNADDGGYSIEKRNPIEHCGGMNNWVASLDINGGTPGKKNSVYTTNPLSFTLKNVDVVSADSIRLEFFKSLDTTTIQLADFEISEGIGNPTQILVEDKHTILLKLTNALIPNTSYTITVFNSFTDCMGNTPLDNIQQQIMFYIPDLYDLVINEMMVDESPTVMLPPTEYIEIYNRKNFPINLKGFQLSVNSTNVQLPEAIIYPDSFIVIVNEVWVQEFQDISIIGLSTWPSLTNTEGTITLRDRKGKLLHSLSYTDNWYRHPSKKDGGWSLEQIDVTKPCLGKLNWIASQNIKGGTPGRINSVNSTITDTVSPYVFGIGVPHPDTILVYFREAVLPSSIVSQYFKIEPNIGIPASANLVEPDLTTLSLKINSSLMPNQIYSLIIEGNILDCSNNHVATDTFQLGLPTLVQFNDVIINEVLFDPPLDGVDYVELFNRSESVIDLKNIFIGTGDTTTGFVNNTKSIFPNSLVFVPGDYRLISIDMDKVLENYTTKNIKSFIEIKSLPSYPNTSGTVTLSDISLQVIDWLNYSDTWHYPLLNSKDGVSLERLNPNAPTHDKSNWHSAAQTVGFGTPGYKNSQTMNISAISDQFKITPEVFSPDQDGWDDVLTIQYNLSQPGFVATLKIFDANGRYVQTIANNELLGTDGYFIWDGINADGSKARIGIHFIWVELIDPSGKREEFKIPCVVGGKI